MSDKLPEVIIIRESVVASLVRDAGTVATFVSLMSIGVYLESTAMQWVGAVIGITTIWARVMRFVRDNRMTTEQARQRLDAIDATAKDPRL
jgi:hypothetical protein